MPRWGWEARRREHKAVRRPPAELPKHYLWNVHISRLSQTQRIKSSLNAKSSLVLYC